ncbi:MAG: MFS transporter [Erysipelotrichales bacterium]|nr:MFS transporter [Erysipelotrichales bacterium]
MNNKLSVIEKIKFGVGDFGLSVITALLQFYMLFFYTDVVGINPGLAGTAILVGKITWDMVHDVLFGYFEDKTKSRWGRRRPYLIFGAVPLMLAFWLLLSIPEGLDGAAAFFAIIGTFILFDTFHTLVATAYSAMTAEITEDYDERTSVSTYRMIFSIIGYLLGAGVTSVLASIISETFGMSVKEAWSAVGLIYGAIAGITIMIPGLFLKTPAVVEAKSTELPPIKAIFSTLKNKPFTKFLVISMIMSTAFTMVTTMLPYYLIYQLEMADSQILVMFLMLGTLAIFLIPCAIISGKLGKAKTYALGIIIAGSALAVGFMLPKGESVLIFFLAAIVGLGFSSQWVCPHSMMPDVIEYDELETGERREGIYYGMQATAGKITGALGSAMCGWGLEWSGYIDGAVQSSNALLAIRGMFALIPAILLLICVPLLLRYPVTKESHEKVVEQLRIRREGEK